MRFHAKAPSDRQRQVLGAVVLGITALLYVGIGVLNTGSSRSPAPRILTKQPAALASLGKWRDFACTWKGQVVARYEQSQVEFVGKDSKQSTWRVFTPTNNTRQTAMEIQVQPANAVCGYVNQ